MNDIYTGRVFALRVYLFDCFSNSIPDSILPTTVSLEALICLDNPDLSQNRNT